MEIDKGTVLNLLRERGQDEKAKQAERDLPDKVDTERDGNLLARFGIDPQDLIKQVTGGRQIPGL